MELFLAIVGLFAVFGLGAGTVIMAQRLLRPGRPPYRPRGIKVMETNEGSRYIEVCADPQSAQRLMRYGRLAHEYTDSYSSDDYWCLWVWELVDFGQVERDVRAMEALPRIEVMQIGGVK